MKSEAGKPAGTQNVKTKQERVEDLDLAGLKKLKRVKSLLLGDRSQAVWLLERGVVAKTYDKHSRAQLGRFDKEVAILKRLSGCRYAPKLYKVDDANKTIYMQYVGRNINLSREQKLTVNKALRRFGEKYHVFRIKGGKARYSYRDLFPANICVDDAGNVKIIDYGSFCWKIHDNSYKKYLAQA